MKKILVISTYVLISLMLVSVAIAGGKKSSNKSGPYGPYVTDWEKFYKEEFGKNYDLSGVQIPQCPEGGGEKYWLVIVAKGLTNKMLFEKNHKKFGVWKSSHDFSKVKSARKPEKHYAIWVTSAKEANRNKGVFTDKLPNKRGMTLGERLVLELFYFRSTGRHIDAKGANLCDGSSCGKGLIPLVEWDGGQLGIRCINSSERSIDELDPRSVYP